MVVSVELFKSSSGSLAKIATFASLDPLVGVPTGNPTQYLRQHNYSFDDLRHSFVEALHKGPYMLELAFQESEGLKETILVPFVEEAKADFQYVQTSLVNVCQKLRNPELIEKFSSQLEDKYVIAVLNEVALAHDIFVMPSNFAGYVGRFIGVAPDDAAIALLVYERLLFQAIDLQLRLALIADNRLKNMAGFTSFTKMKLRLNLLNKQITVKEKQRDKIQQEGNAKQAQKLEQEISIYQKAVGHMSKYLNNQASTMEALHGALNNLAEQIGQEVLQKASEMPATQGKMKIDSTEDGTVSEVLEELKRLTQPIMIILKQDRIAFSHQLLGATLEDYAANIEKARSLFEQIANTHPQKPLFANRLGVILNALGLPDKAAEYFRRALVLLPASKRQVREPIESNLFHALLNKGSFDAALKYMAESLEVGSEECNWFDVERFLPKKILGMGSIGVTFLCEDDYEECLVAIKTLWHLETSSSLKDTFAQALASKDIDSPHITRIYDISRHRADCTFVLMEYCKGIDLEKYVLEHRQGQPLELQEALNIISGTAKGLAAVHCQEIPIVHCGIKPSNILYDIDSGEVKITDLGLSHMQPPAEQIRNILRDSSSIVTQKIADTWNYLSPEQQRGEPLTPASDIYSLAKTLLFLLTGKLPPEELALTGKNQQYLGEFLARCLAANPNDRHSAIDVVNYLQEIEEAIANAAPDVIPLSDAEAIGATDLSQADFLEADMVPMEADMPDMIEADVEAIEATPLNINELEGMEITDLESPMMSADPVYDDSEYFQQQAPDETEAFDLSAGDDYGFSAGDDLGAMEQHGFDLSSGDDLADQQGFDLSASDDLAGQQGFDLSAGDDVGDQQGFDLSASDDLAGQQGFDLSAGNDFGGQQGFDLSASDDLGGQQGFDLSAGDDVGDQQEFDLSAEDDFGAMDQPQNMDIDFADQPMSNVSYDVDDFANTALNQDNAGSGIMVKDQEDAGEQCGLYPTAALPQISLSLGYAMEGEIIICEKDGATMVYVPPGVFTMGYEGQGTIFGEGPEHEITVNGYLIDECPVTWYQYTLFCDETDRKKPPLPSWELDESQPVVNITWEDAEAYAKWADKSLPTEAQWEKAAKGGHFFDGDDHMLQKNQGISRRYPWGDSLPNAGEEWAANCSGEPQYGQRNPSPVGLYAPGISPYGCMDMSGNVWEWCQDWYSDTYYKTCPSANPKGPKSGFGRVIRGGAWNSDHQHITTTFRGWMEPEKWWNIIGFRTVRNLR